MLSSAPDPLRCHRVPPGSCHGEDEEGVCEAAGSHGWVALGCCERAGARHGAVGDSGLRWLCPAPRPPRPSLPPEPININHSTPLLLPETSKHDLKSPPLPPAWGHLRSPSDGETEARELGRGLCLERGRPKLFPAPLWGLAWRMGQQNPWGGTHGPTDGRSKAGEGDFPGLEEKKKREKKIKKRGKNY